MATINETDLGRRLRTHGTMRFLGDHPYPLLYATVHGSTLYGFDRPDSDRDLRGCHVLPIEQVLGLQEGQETITRKEEWEDSGVELVTHEVKKVFRLLLNRNGNILEEVLSPLILATGDLHAELKEIAAQCVTRGHAGHYLGMASQIWSVLKKPERRQTKYALPHVPGIPDRHPSDGNGRAGVLPPRPERAGSPGACR